MPNVGYATLQIIPSVRGISDELRRQLVGPAGDAGERAGESAGGGFRDAFTGALAAIGVAELASKAGEQFIDAFNESIDQANVTSRLQAQLGAGGKDASRYGSIVGSLYAKGITDSFEQGAEVIRSIVNGKLVDPKASSKQLEAVAKQMTDVSNTFETDLNRQAEAVSAILKNKLAPNATAALDIITTGFQKLGPNAEDLLDTFQEYPVQLRKLGIDAKTALGLFQQGIQGGARDTDIIADAFKEFSIRSIDMAQSSQDAYKLLGLDAAKMSLQIAKGGTQASSGLQLVLDRLHAIKDPVTKNAAAVGLFGTQAEDLGGVLAKLDPRTAAKGFTDVAGSAGRLGDVLHSGPSHELEVFTRGLKQGLVNFLGSQVLPMVTRFGHGVNTFVLPPLRTAGSLISTYFLPTLASLVKAGAATVNWLKEWGVWLAPIAVLIGGITLALSAQAIAAGITTAVFAAYRAVILAGTAVTQGFAAAQALLNSVLALNPITLIVIALIALGTALVIAYKKSDTFRRIVQGAWEGIQTAAMWAWNNVLKPALNGIVTAFKWVAAAAMWLWTNALKPAFSFIAAAAKILATILIVIVVGPIIAIFKILAAVVGWLWRTFIKPVFQLIGALAMWLWTNALKPAFDKVVAVFKLLAFVANWLWRTAIKPVFDLIAGKVAEWWRKARVVFDVGVAYIKNVLAPAFVRFWTNTIKPVWEGIKATIAFVWQHGIKPTFDFLKRGVDQIKESFKVGVSAIGKIWDGLKAIAKKPVQFIVDTVYNNGIRKVWNTVADFTGAGKLGAIKFAGGGRTRGGTPGKDSIPALMMADEYVIRRSAARKLGFGTLDYINRHGALPGFAAGGPVQHFKDGGLVGWIKDKASGIGNFFSDVGSLLVNPGKAWAAATGFIRTQLNSIAGTGFGKLMTGIPLKILSALKDKVVGLVGDVGKSDVGGSGVQRWSSVVLQALKLVGQPANYLGITLRRMNQESGGNPNAINNWDINAKNGTPSKGLMQVIQPTFDAYAGALAGRGIWDPLANIYASMRYALSRYGSLPSAYNRAGGYASGGSPRPGEIAWVGENGPELIKFSGGEVVYSNRDSMRMMAGLGGLRGFAKGTARTTARAAARKAIPGDLGAFTKSLTGSAAGIAAAAAKLAKDLKAAGGAGARFAASTNRASSGLQGLARKRDAVNATLAAARQAAVDQRQTATDFLGLSNLSDSGSVSSLIQGMKGRQATLKTFQANINSLSKKGLSQDLIRQLVALGPDSALAGVVAGADKGDIKMLNSLAQQGGRLAAGFGNNMADLMFDAGKNASKGFLTGLTAQQKEIDAAMARLGASLVRSIKKSLKIKSPSQVLRDQVGVQAGRGIAIGLDSTASQVAAAAGRVAGAAVPSRPGAGTAAAVGGARAGTRMTLVVGGREFDAYLTEVADGRVNAYDQSKAMARNAGRRY